MIRGRTIWLVLLLMSWVSTATRLFPHAAQVEDPHPLRYGRHGTLTQGVLGGKITGEDVRGNELRGLSTPGSRPPSCEHKCGRCMPCAAIQVPTITAPFAPQYANYEPEGWKCKCGSSFFNP